MPKKSNSNKKTAVLGGKNNKNMSKKSAGSINIYRKIAISFIVLTLVLVAIVVYFSVVSVKIVLIPNQERTTTSFITTVKDADSQQTVSGTSVGGAVEGVSVSVSEIFQTEGKEIQDSEVSGLVTIINNHSSDQPLIKTTRLLTEDGHLYRLKETVRIPAGGKVENVPMYADETNKSMEIAETGIKFTIPGLRSGLQDKIYAESASPVKFTEIGDTMISNGDITRAQEALKQKLMEKVAKLADVKQYKGRDTVIYNIDDNKVNYETSAKVGDKVDKFNMSATVEAAIVAFNIGDISSLAQMKVEENLPEDKQLANFNKDNFEFTIDRYDVDKKIADLKVEVIAQMIIDTQTDIIKPEKLVGLTRDQLDDYLSSLREIAGFEVKFTPSWLKKVPSLVDHVKIEIAN